MSEKISVVLIGVNYETDDETLRFIEGYSTAAQNAKDNNITINAIIVDNTERKTSEDFFLRLKAVNSEILCFKAPKNLGYFGGAHYGLTKFLEERNFPDWVIVSNVDIEFKDKNFITNIKDLITSENIGVVAPSIWSNRSLRDLNPRLVNRITPKRMAFYKKLFSNFYLGNLYELLAAVKHFLKFLWNHKVTPALKPTTRRINSSLPSNSPEILEIYAPQGSCIIFSKEFFRRGGTLDYPLFLFYEEIYVAETALKLGLRVIYYPTIKMWHNDHISTGMIRSRKVAAYVAESAKYIAETYFSEDQKVM